MGEKRRAPRVPILTQVEAQGDAATALGHARDISLGGMLIETPETLREGATVIVRFFLPPERKPIQAAGKVVRVEDGKAMGIAFLGLRPTDQEKVVSYIQEAHPSSPGLRPEELAGVKLAQRRSARILRRLPLVLSWQDDEGRPQQEPGETQLLSRYGATVLTFTGFEPGHLLRITVPDTGKQGVARVVWAQASQLGARVQVGLEMLGTDDFWGIEFPAHRPEAAAEIERDRRRGARLARSVPVVLIWTDEFGRLREAEAETEILSQHGALVRSPVVLPLHQRLRLRAPEINREAEAEVVWVEPSAVPGQTDLAIEFVDTEDFWGIPFPSEEATGG
jgi:hypothetical protein